MSQNNCDGSAEFPQYVAQGAVECVDVLAHPEALDSGWWAVVGEPGGRVRGWRFTHVERRKQAPTHHDEGRPWGGPQLHTWRSSLTAERYVAAVEQIQTEIARGALQQCNLTRVLSAPLPSGAGAESNAASAAEPDAGALFAQIRRHHSAPFGGYIHIPDGGEVTPAWLVSASPELFLRRDGSRIGATPIKGTAPAATELQPKDEMESLFVAGEVAAEFTHVCAAETVEISPPRVEEHPGLVQLVRDVWGELDPQFHASPWEMIFTHLFPPASVAGFPRAAAAAAIERLETADRGPYCGVFGWVDGDRQQAELAVTIRSFWWNNETLYFGTGAGITAESDPVAEWEETELKQKLLLDLASAGSARASYQEE